MKKFSNFPAAIEAKCKTHPHTEILTFIQGDQSTSWTYEQLGFRIRTLAKTIEKNSAMGDRVMILLPPGLEYIASYLACLYSKRIAVPLYPPRANREDERIPKIFKDAKATLALVNAQANLVSLKRFKKIVTDNIATEPLKMKESFSIKGDAVAFLQYTSGSTAAPKGVMVTHQNLLANCQALAEQFHVPGLIKKACSWLPPYHDMGLIGGILFPLYSGLPVVLFSPQQFVRDPLFWLTTLEKYKVNISSAPNFVYDLCAKEIEKNPALSLNLSEFKIALDGSEPLNPKTFNHFNQAIKRFDVKSDILFPCYGLAEATLLVTNRKLSQKNIFLSVDKNILQEKHIASISKQDHVNFVSCGSVISHHELLIVDSKTKELKKALHIGEIWLRGPSIAKGYWQKNKKTTETFKAQLKNANNKKHYLRTGDLGFLDQSGHLYVVSRIKDLIILRGRNYYPGDIEHSLENVHPDLVLHGGAAVSFMQAGTERLAIVHEVKRHTKDFEAIFNAIQKKIYQEFDIIPDKILFIAKSSLAKTSSGKIKRHACQEALEKGTFSPLAEWTSPQLLTERKPLSPISKADSILTWLTDWIVNHLNIAPNLIKKEMTFAQLGLDSVYALRLLHDIEKHYNIQINPTLLQENPTLDKATQWLKKQLSTRKKRSLLKQDTQSLINQIDQLSKKEVKMLLKHLKQKPKK